ncbi:MAG TPA: LLM class flavin-dependent oxidoreductase [Actinomycetota bacterium]|nr:LLM class flavin-dependent oxidoreductase [Actinomycetota bacterium]
MRFGLALPHYDTSLAGAPASWDGVARVARAAEHSGWDSVWVSDHLFLDWGKYGGPADVQGSLECWTTMSALAAVTERVRIGSLALCNDLRNPALVAKMAATLDVLSGGRVDVGLGAGWYEPEYRAAGIPFERAGTRIRRLGEAAEIAGRMLAGEELTFAGRHYRVDAAICTPQPVQRPRPPIWVGGKGDLLLETAVRVADGWNFSWLGSFETYRERTATADRLCEKAGRDPASLRRSVGAYVVTGADRADLDARAERVAARTPAGVLGAGPVSLDELGASRVVGTTGEVVERLGGLADLGVEEVVVTLGVLPFQVADEEDVELFGREVAAALQGEDGGTR